MSIDSIFPISFWQALGISAALYLTHVILLTLTRTNKPKTPPIADTRPFIPILLLSHTLELITNPSFITTQSLKHGPLLQFHTVLGLSIAIASASAIKFFHRLDGKCLDGCLPGHWVELLGAHSVGVVSGDVHKRLRRTVLGVFTVKALKGWPWLRLLRQSLSIPWSTCLIRRIRIRIRRVLHCWSPRKSIRCKSH